MKFSEKISFLEDSLKLNDKEFSNRYKIKLAILKKWKNNELSPTEKEVINICNDFKLDAKDFLSNESTLKEPVGKEHPCAMLTSSDRSNVIYEDFAREDNSRYEEKD